MQVPEELRERIDRWDRLSRWERSEVGKELRRLGLSYGEIASLIDVKKSTLATWCRDIELSEELKAAIRERTGSRAGIPVDTNWRRREEIAVLCAQARDRAEVLIHDPRWIAGVVLYWAEGSKTRNHLEVANSDPRALRVFIGWLRSYVDPAVEFVLQLHLHEGNDERAAQEYWKSETGLDEVDFHKTFIKPRGTGHRKNHLEHGICRVRVRRSADRWNIVMAWVDYVAGALPGLMDSRA